MGKTPIIIINPDEMRSDAMGHMGNPMAQTPFLDRMAEQEAVSFSNAYCQNPVCVPSRCSFLTGLYPHVLGHRTMSYLLHEKETSLFQELKNAGYYVWMNARNDLVAGQIEGLAASHANEIYYGEKKELPPNVDVLQMIRSHMGGRDDNPFPYSHFLGRSDGGQDNDMQDTLAAIDRILHPADDRPLCLFLGWTNPHPPYQAEEPFFSSIDRSRLWERIPYDETSGKCAMIARLREKSGMAAYSEEQWNELRSVYLAQCRKVDTMFEMVCDALKQAGIYDDSAIFFLSDHGDFCGDYDLPEKAQNTFEDCLMKVPLLIKPPKGEQVDPGVTGALTELVDFYATVMDYAGVEPTHDHFGRSLRPVIAARTTPNRNYVFAEGGRLAHEIQCDEAHASGNAMGGAYGARKAVQTEALPHEKGTMIFDGRYKYVHRPSGNNELYDLSADPGERTNLYPQEKDSAITAKLRAELLDWYQQTCDVVPREYDTRFTSERVWASVQNLCPPELEETVRAYISAEHPDIMSAIGYTVQLIMRSRKQSC